MRNAVMLRMPPLDAARLGCLVLALAVAAAGCDDDGGGGGGGGDMDAGPGGGGDTDGGGGGDTDGGGGGDTDAGPGGGGDDCASQAMAYCSRLAECHPDGLLARYETEEICRRARTNDCENPVEIPSTNGLVDEDACRQMAVGGDCDAFISQFGGPLPEACRPAPGDVTTIQDFGTCFLDAQCGDIMRPDGIIRPGYCQALRRTEDGVEVINTGTLDCPRGGCVPAIPEGERCSLLSGSRQEGVFRFCDRIGGEQCVRPFDADMGTDPTEDTTCRTITYGTSGDPCAPGSDRQCASGFRCARTLQCMAVFPEGATCNPEDDLCDQRLGLTCRDRPGDGVDADVCTGPVYVPIGAQCGMVERMGEQVMQLCSAYAICDTTASPPQCIARRQLGETCTVGMSNCEPGLECDETSNRCEVPEPGMCP